MDAFSTSARFIFADLSTNYKVNYNKLYCAKKKLLNKLRIDRKNKPLE